MSQQTQSPLEPHRERIEQWISVGTTYGAILDTLEDEYGVQSSERSLRRALDRWDLPRPGANPAEQAGVKVDGDQAEATSRPSLDYNSPDDLLLERGLDPEEWEVHSTTVNEWDSPTGDIMKQLKINCRRKKPVELIQAAELDLNLPAPKGQSSKSRPRTIVCVGDQQAPFHDRHLHDLFQTFLADQMPDEGILIGDTADFPTISRHPAEPEWAPTVQQCVNSTGQIIYDYRNASPHTLWKKLAGNHDERLRRAAINNVAEYYNLKPAELETLPELPAIHSPQHLFRLDELKVEFIEAKGSYEHTQVKISKFLAARHGWLARKNSGSSAHATLDHLGHSIIVGHTHRQSRVHQTKHTIDGLPVVNTAVETGCMCRIQQGLGYAVAPDWQNGFAVTTVWPDGTFSIDLATFVDGILFYRDKRYS